MYATSPTWPKGEGFGSVPAPLALHPTPSFGPALTVSLGKKSIRILPTAACTTTYNLTPLLSLPSDSHQCCSCRERSLCSKTAPPPFTPPLPPFLRACRPIPHTPHTPHPISTAHARRCSSSAGRQPVAFNFFLRWGLHRLQGWWCFWLDVCQPPLAM